MGGKTVACYLDVVLTIWGHLLMGICLWYSRQTMQGTAVQTGCHTLLSR